MLQDPKLSDILGCMGIFQMLMGFCGGDIM